MKRENAKSPETEGIVNNIEKLDASSEIEDNREAAADSLHEELEEAKDRYLRLYAEFDNYKKKMIKDKEELTRYSNESLVYELLAVIDNLEMALKHIDDDGGAVEALKKGVENTHRELLRTLEKSGLKVIAACQKPFDPAVHHAMSTEQCEGYEPNMVVEEFRKGYMYKEKVLRPSLVKVSKRAEQ
ncbi:MAG: nucleotide exchange factor GrpE [Dissulfurispiraceae bacterium]|nr:nucleotide exchange factor GrpE [Dissulfurispiraceae bacterium]